MNNFKIGVIKTSWYEDQIQIMVDTITSVQGPVYEIKKVPGSLELAAGGKAFLEQGPDALIFCI
jgi:6,7-dimethyl-8-ribityllumazine synthase